MAVLSLGAFKQGKLRKLLVKSSAALFGVAFAGAAAAQETLNYNYIEVSWVFQDDLEADALDAVGIGGVDVDHGVWFKGSGEFIPKGFLKLSANDIKMEADAEFGSTGLNTYSLALGGYLPMEQWFGMQQPFHLTGEVSYERLHFIDHTDGWGLALGFRWQPVTAFEVNGAVGWRDYGTFAGEDLADWVYEVGVAVNLTDNWALTGDWQMLDLELGDGDFELNTFRIGARWNF
jgi:opacity protein-like surface antigen